MKKLLFTLLMGLFMSPLQLFADHYPYEEMMPYPGPPPRSPIVHQVVFDLDYYTGDMAVYAMTDITDLNITIAKSGVTYLNTTVALCAGQSYTDSLAGYAEGSYTLILSTNDGVIALYKISVIAD